MNKSNKKIPLTLEGKDLNRLEKEAGEWDLPLSTYLRLVVLGKIKRGNTPPKDFNK